MLRKVTFLSLDKDDVRLWHPDAKGKFPVQSFYDILIGFQARKVGRNSGMSWFLLESWFSVGWSRKGKSLLWISCGGVVLK